MAASVCLWGLALAGLVVRAAGASDPAPIPNFAEVTVGAGAAVPRQPLYRGGQPPEAAYAALKTQGIGTVVCLRRHRRTVARERQLAEAVGMRFVHIPMDSLAFPTDAAVERFLQVVTDPAAGPVFAHCEAGRQRVGVMVACCRVALDGWTVAAASKEMQVYGFRSFWFGHLKEYLLTFARARGQRHVDRSQPVELVKTYVLWGLYHLRYLDPTRWLLIIESIP